MEHWGIDWTAETAAAYLRDFFEEKRFIGYVFEADGQVVGCLLAVCRLAGSRQEIHLHEMAVLPQYQGRGIGKQLLNALQTLCHESGLAGIVLYTSKYAPAARFYESNGFHLSDGTICMYWE